MTIVFFLKRRYIFLGRSKITRRSKKLYKISKSLNLIELILFGWEGKTFSITEANLSKTPKFLSKKTVFWLKKEVSDDEQKFLETWNRTEKLVERSSLGLILYYSATFMYYTRSFTICNPKLQILEKKIKLYYYSEKIFDKI